MKCVLLFIACVASVLLICETHAPRPHNQEAEELRLAAGRGEVAKVRRLLASGVPASARDCNDHDALGQATLAGHGEIVRILLSAGADPDTRDASGYTPLMKAVMSAGAYRNPPVADADDAVIALLEKGANPNARTARGLTALMMAGFNGNVSAVRRLLAAGADSRAVDRRGQTALSMAISNLSRSTEPVEIVEAMECVGLLALASGAQPQAAH